MSLIALILASLFEILWVSLLGEPSTSKSIKATLLLAVAMVLSLYCLSVATKEIPTAICYASWVGIGIFGQALIQHFVFERYLTVSNWFFLTLLSASVLGLLLTQSNSGAVLK